MSDSPPIRVKPLDSVLVKPAGADCNLRCRYCFYLEKGALYPEIARHRMSEEVLEATVRQMMEGGSSQVQFGWQGGEPTLMGLDFFKRAVEFQKRYGERGQTVGNGLQTNGLLIDDAWAAFLAQYNVLVGLSLDGPQHIHDHYRRSADGRGSWERVMRALHAMTRAGVAVNPLSVVSDHSVAYPEEIYDFHRSVGLQYMQFIPCVESDGAESAGIADFSVAPKAYGEFLCRLFDRWIKDFKNGWPTTSIRWFESLLFTYVGREGAECTLQGECGRYVVVEHNGDVYACDFFVDPDWKLGNVLEGDLIEMLNGARQRTFGQCKADLPEACRACRWLKHCWGGCNKSRLVDPRTDGDNYFCPAYKMFFEHAHDRLERLGERWIETERKRAAREGRRRGR